MKHISQAPLPRTLVLVHATDILAGGERSLLNLIRHLDAARFRPHVICDAGEEFIEAAREAGAAVDRVRFPGFKPPGPSAWRAVRALAQCCVSAKGALLHANTPKTNLYAAAAGFLTGLPVVWHCRNLLEPGMWDTDRLCAWMPDRIICNSDAIATRFVGSRWRERVRTILNGVDLQEFDAAISASAVRAELGWERHPILAATSRLDPEKGHETLLEAMGMVVAERPDARLLIAGQASVSPEARRAVLQRRIEELKLGAAVRILGFRRDMPQILAAADICILPADAEACGRVLFEAMAMAKPIVATASGGTPEIVLDGVTGLLVPPHEPRALAHAVLSLLNDPLRRKVLSAAAYERVTKQFSIGAHVRQTMEVYSEVLESRGIR
ncbi:MAG: glycosyltransferase family 1 protein [Nitrospirae bacterium]|nr:MAG: glycosyltransferase family 1 protein [Nitrospirota bacterium]